jgi:hypothetical protein
MSAVMFRRTFAGTAPSAALALLQRQKTSKRQKTSALNGKYTYVCHIA